MPLSRSRPAVWSLAITAVLGCTDKPPSGEAPAPPDVRPATDLSHNAYGHAVAELISDHWLDVRAGKALFVTVWVARGQAEAERAVRGPASQVREGLGPLFNEPSCQECHFRDGRGRPVHLDEPGRPRTPDRPGPRLLRLGLVGPDGELVPDPSYGGQLQDHAVAPAVAEGAFDVASRAIRGAYPDATPFTLEAPVITLRELRHGALPPATRVSLRVPPPLIGLGLLEAIPEAAIIARADPDDADGDGISGRANRVRDPATGDRALGRFGWKAGQPSLWLQNATALREDLGVTTPVFPEPPGAPELDGIELEHLTRYTRLLGPPARRPATTPELVRGEAVFARVGCPACHTPRFETGDVVDLPELGHRTIEPYSDLLLHDMGEALSDHRPEGDARGPEWRTAPLWGLGLLRAVTGDVRLLHDGRARSPEQAVLWHGGEAAAARDRFAAASREDRAALLRFVETL